MRIALPDAAAAVGTILLAVGALYSFPREGAGDAPALPALRIVLVDTSASAVSRRHDWSRYVRAALSHEAEEAQREAEEVCVVAFGDDVRRLFGPATADEFRSWIPDPSTFGAGAASRLNSALEVALDIARVPGRVVCRIVLVGDGTYTGIDPAPLLARLRESGVVLTRADLPPADVVEIIPGPLSLPMEVEAGAPIAVQFDVFYAPGNREQEERVEFALRDIGGPRLRIPVPTGLPLDADGYLRWRFRGEIGRAEPGWNAVRIFGQSERGAESSVRAEGGVRGTGVRVIGLVGCEEPSAEHPGLEFVPVSPGRLAERLSTLDALVTCDVPLAELPLPLLRSFVERGGGWLARLDDDSLPGLVPGAPGLDLLPLRLPDDHEPRDVVFLVDRSGSMTGRSSENVRQAVFGLLDEALPEDSVELRWFSDRLADPIPLIGPEDSRSPRELAETRRIASDRIFADRTTGGPTAILRALDALATERERSGRQALVLLLTDGRENIDPDPAGSAPRLRERLRSARARLVALAAGNLADRALLAQLVAPGDAVLEVGDLLLDSIGDRIGDLFRRELQRDRFLEGERQRILPALGLLAASAAPGLGAEILEAMGPESPGDWPTMGRTLRMKASPDAEVLWISEEGDPLLAIHRIGLGLIAATPLSAGPTDSLLAPLLRTLVRGKRGAATNARIEGDQLRIDGLPIDAPAELEARVFASVSQDEDPPLAVIALSPSLEGQDPRRARRGRWPALDSFDSACVEIRARANSVSWEPIRIALSVPREPEFTLPRARIPPFESYGAGGARAAPVRGRDPHPHPVAPWILLSGMILLTGAGLTGGFTRRAR